MYNVKFDFPPFLIILLGGLIFANSDAKCENTEVHNEYHHQEFDGALLEETLQTKAICLFEAVNFAYYQTKRGQRHQN